MDRRRVVSEVSGWAQTLVAKGIAEPRTFGFPDGKAVRFCKPGQGNTASRYARQHGLAPNMVQRAYYNGALTSAESEKPESEKPWQT